MVLVQTDGREPFELRVVVSAEKGQRLKGEVIRKPLLVGFEIEPVLERPIGLQEGVRIILVFRIHFLDVAGHLDDVSNEHEHPFLLHHAPPQVLERCFVVLRVNWEVFELGEVLVDVLVGGNLWTMFAAVELLDKLDLPQLGVVLELLDNVVEALVEPGEGQEDVLEGQVFNQDGGDLVGEDAFQGDIVHFHFFGDGQSL